MYWLHVGLVRSLKSPHKEALMELLLCEDYNDLTSPWLRMTTSQSKQNNYDCVGICLDIEDLVWIL